MSISKLIWNAAKTLKNSHCVVPENTHNLHHRGNMETLDGWGKVKDPGNSCFIHIHLISPSTEILPHNFTKLMDLVVQESNLISNRSVFFFFKACLNELLWVFFVCVFRFFDRLIINRSGMQCRWLSVWSVYFNVELTFLPKLFFQRVWGMCIILIEIAEGWEVIFCIQKLEIPWLGYGYFLKQHLIRSHYMRASNFCIYPLSQSCPITFYF